MDNIQYTKNIVGSERHPHTVLQTAHARHYRPANDAETAWWYVNWENTDGALRSNEKTGA